MIKNVKTTFFRFRYSLNFEKNGKYFIALNDVKEQLISINILTWVEKLIQHPLWNEIQTSCSGLESKISFLDISTIVLCKSKKDSFLLQKVKKNVTENEQNPYKKLQMNIIYTIFWSYVIGRKISKTFSVKVR